MTLECQDNPKPQPDTYGSISLPGAVIIFLAVLVVIALLLTASKPNWPNGAAKVSGNTFEHT